MTTPFKTTLITGASAGIGRALAFEFAARGHNLVLLARRQDLLLQLKDEILTKYSVGIFCGGVDVTDERGLRAAVSQAQAIVGQIDTVIANAGFGVSGDFEKLTLADYQRQFEVNVFGVLKTLYAALEELKKNQGRVAIIASTNAYLSVPGNTAYCMSKFAVRALAEGLHAEFDRHGIAVTLINPGFIDTDIRKTSNHGVLGSDKKDPVPAWLMMDVKKAARKIYRAIAARRRERAITTHSQIGIWLTRFFPGVVALLMRWVARRS